MSPSSRTGGELLVECLSNLGVTTSFGVPGSYLAVLDALYDADIKFTLCRHESAAGFCGCGKGKLTRSPGIGFVTRGPGATNASIGVHTAMQDSSPMILFISQVGVNDKGVKLFRRWIIAPFLPTCKMGNEIDNPDRIPGFLAVHGILHFLGVRASGGGTARRYANNLSTYSEPCQRVTIAEAGVDTGVLEQALRCYPQQKPR